MSFLNGFTITRTIRCVTFDKMNFQKHSSYPMNHMEKTKKIWINWFSIWSIWWDGCDIKLAGSLNCLQSSFANWAKILKAIPTFLHVWEKSWTPERMKLSYNESYLSHLNEKSFFENNMQKCCIVFVTRSSLKCLKF